MFSRQLQICRHLIPGLHCAKTIQSIKSMAHSSSASSSDVGIRQKFASGGRQPFTIFIEGNIGSGKTTFLNYFNKFRDDICLVTEPVEKWRNLNGTNLLDLMYKEPNRWALPFQSYVTLTMLQGHTLPTTKRIKLMERSLYSSRRCFVENMRKNGTLDVAMYDILQDWYDFIEKSIHIQSDLIVYLRTSPEVVYQRMLKRARSEECCVPLKYLQELHELHEDWLIRKRYNLNVNVLTINADQDLEKMVFEYERSEQMINDSINLSSDKAPLVSPSKRQRVSS